MNSNQLKNVVSNLTKMTVDSLKIHENEDGSFSFEWDKDDPNWNWMNNLTSKELESIITEAIRKQFDSDD